MLECFDIRKIRDLIFDIRAFVCVVCIISFLLLHFHFKNVHSLFICIFISWWRFVVILPQLQFDYHICENDSSGSCWMDFNSITFHFWIELNWIYGLIENLYKCSTCIECIIRTFAFAVWWWLTLANVCVKRVVAVFHQNNWSTFAYRMLAILVQT